MALGCANHTARCPGPVKKAHWLNAILPGSNAHAESDTGIGELLSQVRLEALPKCMIILLLFTVDGKTVPFKAATNSFCAFQKLRDFFSYSLEHLVSEFSAMQLVHRMELFQVHHNSIHLL